MAAVQGDLGLSDQKLGDAEVAVLAAALTGNTNITSLSLGSNKIGDAGAASLAALLKSNTNMAWMNLVYNQIGNAGVAALIELATANGALVAIEIYGNPADGAECARLAAVCKVAISQRVCLPVGVCLCLYLCMCLCMCLCLCLRLSVWGVGGEFLLLYIVCTLGLCLLWMPTRSYLHVCLLPRAGLVIS